MSVQDPEELYRTLKIIERKDYINAITAVGRDNTTIGVVTESREDLGIDKGLVVLFSKDKDKQPEPGKHVACIDYEKRQSKSGKYYVKCFQWVYSDELERYADELRKKLLEYKIDIILRSFPEKYAGILREFIISGNIPDANVDAVIFYLGDIPLKSYNSNIYIAIVDDNGVYEYSDDDVMYSSKLMHISLGNMCAVPVEIMPEEIPENARKKIRIVKIYDDNFFAITKDKRLAKALRMLSDYEGSLSTETIRKIVEKILALLPNSSGGEN